MLWKSSALRAEVSFAASARSEALLHAKVVPLLGWALGSSLLLHQRSGMGQGCACRLSTQWAYCLQGLAWLGNLVVDHRVFGHDMTVVATILLLDLFIVSLSGTINTKEQFATILSQSLLPGVWRLIKATLASHLDWIQLVFELHRWGASLTWWARHAMAWKLATAQRIANLLPTIELHAHLAEFLGTLSILKKLVFIFSIFLCG